MTAPTGPQSPAWYDTTATRAPRSTPQLGAHAAARPGAADPETVRTHAVYGAPADAAPAPAVGKPARTVGAKVAAAIGVVAFLLGVGVSMLTGPLLGGGPGGAPGDGQGGPPGTSQQSGTTGTGSSSGTTGATTGTSS